MLTPDYLRGMPIVIVELYEQLERDIVEDIARRIAIDIKLTATADYQIKQLVGMGFNFEEIQREIAKTNGMAMKEMTDLFENTAKLAHENDKVLYANGGKNLPDMTEAMQAQVRSTVKVANYDLKNLTQSLGVAKDSKNAVDLTKKYQDALNYASIQLGSATVTQNQAVKTAVQSLMDAGITDITYPSGAKARVDVAVARAVRTQSGRVASIISEENAERMGQDLMEITSHIGARPDHADWQGEIVSRSGQSGYLSLTDIGYQDTTGFMGINCRHDWYPFFEGIDQPIPKVVEPDAVEYEGRTYDSYEQTQKQRYHERNIRETKREIAGYKGAGLTDDARSAQIKLNRQQDEYRKFSEAVNRRPKYERTGITLKSQQAPPIVGGKVPELPKVKEKYVRPLKGYKSTSEAFSTISYRNIDKDFARKIDEQLLDLANNYPITKRLQIKSSSSESFFGVSKTGVTTRKEKGQTIVYFRDDISYSNKLQKDELTSLNYHLREMKRRGSKLQSPLATIDHEYGHAIDNYYKTETNPAIKRMKETFVNGRSLTNESVRDANWLNGELGKPEGYLSTKLYDRMQKELNLSDYQMAERVGKEFGSYAQSDVKEFLAEGFANSRHIPRNEVTPFLKMFEEIMNDLFDEVAK